MPVFWFECMRCKRISLRYHNARTCLRCRRGNLERMRKATSKEVERYFDKLTQEWTRIPEQ
jgi:hypothetical protein